MRNRVFALAIFTYLAGCDAAKDYAVSTDAELPVVVLMNEINGPGAFVHFRQSDSQCSYLGELTADGYAALSRMECPDSTNAPLVKGVQSYVFFGAMPPKVGMSFPLRDGVPKVMRSEDGILVAIANFLASIGQKFESQN